MFFLWNQYREIHLFTLFKSLNQLQLQRMMKQILKVKTIYIYIKKSKNSFLQCFWGETVLLLQTKGKCPSTHFCACRNYRKINMNHRTKKSLLNFRNGFRTVWCLSEKTRRHFFEPKLKKMLNLQHYQTFHSLHCWIYWIYIVFTVWI